MANPSPAPQCVTRQAPQLHPHLCRVGPVSVLCTGGISVYFTNGETEAGESRGVGAVLGHPSIQLGPPRGDRRLGGYPPSGLTLSSWEEEAVLPAAVGERALT